uniref:Uncharacterized protein n=1 Tax=Romanomermis culicivorax TaxID=13658 RepID=A0A915HN89_ROMCU
METRAESDSRMKNLAGTNNVQQQTEKDYIDTTYADNDPKVNDELCDKISITVGMGSKLESLIICKIFVIDESEMSLQRVKNHNASVHISLLLCDFLPIREVRPTSRLATTNWCHKSLSAKAQHLAKIFSLKVLSYIYPIYDVSINHAVTVDVENVDSIGEAGEKIHRRFSTRRASEGANFPLTADRTTVRSSANAQKAENFF